MFPFNRSRRVINTCIIAVCAIFIGFTAAWEPNGGPAGGALVHFSGHDIQVQPSAGSPLEPGGNVSAPHAYYVLHVSPEGTDDGDGSFEKPLSTPGAALRLARAVKDPAVMIYVWGGTYRFVAQESDSGVFLIDGDILLTGSSEKLLLGDALALPALNDVPTIFEVSGLRGSSLDDLYQGSALFRIGKEGRLRLNAVALRASDGSGSGVLLDQGVEPGRRDARPAGVYLLNAVEVSGFGAGIYCQTSNLAVISLGANNIIRENTLAGIVSGGGDVLVGSGNKIADNYPRNRQGETVSIIEAGRLLEGCGIISSGGNLLVRDGNSITHNNVGILSHFGTVIIGGHNEIGNNIAAGIVATAGSITLGNSNSVSENGGDGLQAQLDVIIGSSNRIEYNSGSGINAMAGEVDVNGSNNSISHNGRAGILNGNRVNIYGNFNFIRRNSKLKKGSWQDVSARGGVLNDAGNNNDIPTAISGAS